MSGINENNGQNEEEKRTEINEEIYRTPDVTRSEETVETTETVETVETVEAEVVTDEESASLPEQSGIRPYGGYSDNSQYYSGYPNGGQPGSSYQGSQPNNGQPYNNYPSGQSYNGYPGGSQPNSGQPYNNYPNSGQPYNNYPGGQPYNGYPSGQPNNGQSYNNYSGGQPNNGQPYNNYSGGQPAQNSNGSGYQPYGGGSSNVPPYNNGQYSPFATPPKKNKNGLVIGIVIGVIVLFLIGVFALAYIMYSRLAESAYHERESSQSGRDYDFDDDIRTPKRENKDDDDYDSYDDYDDYDDYYDDDYYDDDYYDDYYDDDYYDNDDYYDFHDAIDYSLSYSVEFDEYYEGTENGNSIIQIIYPIISGDDVPHLEVLNETLQDEVEYLKDVFWENAGDSEEDSMYVMAEAYVTYMDEEKLSIVYQETVYSYDDMYEAYLFCVNFDMEKGLVLDNQDILSLDDDFSVDFRQRSDEQNGEISSLTSMSDQEITEYFNSDDVIVFYTPLGMEIGFNYYDGWVTVTYKEYQQYLKVS